MPFYCIEGGASVTNDLFLFIGILSGPTVALIYSLSIWIAYALSHEIPWISKLPDILVPVSILQVAAIACSLALVICDDDDDDDDGNENDQAEAHFGSGRVALLKQIIPTIFFWMASIYYMRWIRIHEVVGISNTRPFYGEFHLEGKVVLITGANAGIGKETAAQLASMGCSTIVFLCRSEARAAKAIRALVQRGVGKEEQFQFCPCDLGDFASIRKAVDRIQSKLSISAVDVLINNAGLLMGTKTISKDGYELMMQANHLGHFLLTQLLLGRGVLQNDKSRIINLTSSTYKLAKDGFDFDDIFCDKRRKYTMFGQYSMTKLANVLYSKELSRRYPELLVFAVHPGIVRTNVTSNMVWYLRIPNGIFAWYVASIQKTSSQGAFSSVLCATAPKDMLPPSGSFVHNCKSQSISGIAESKIDGKRLWQASDVLVGLSS